jgi:predicted dehydrogenase
MRADFSFGDGRTGRITTSMWSSHVLDLRARVVGSDATLKIFNPTTPQMFNRVSISGKGKRHERIKGGATYEYQLEAFRAAVQDGAPTLTPPSESILNMTAIDSIYRAAGMSPRRGATDPA